MTSAWPWWQRGIIYQIYPRSFADSDGDGIGDLAGILQRLDYLTWLGVDAVWLSPIHPSPMADFGYDVSDYTDVDPVFGTLDDFDRLVAEMHRRDLKLVLDFVANHTSDRHPWFLEARAARDGAKRDWYIWRDPAPDGGPPNNWLSEFGGSAWEFDAATGQYYYHAYLTRQPDLNWRNPAVRRAMHDVLRFWLRRGVDGFRIDAVYHLIKDDRFRDNPPNPAFHPDQPPHLRLLRQHTTDRPEVHDILAEMRRITDGYPDRVLIGEAYLPIDRLIAYYGAEGRGVHLPFNFHLIGAPWDARAIATIIAEYEAALPPACWPNWVLGNHDRSRVASRVGLAQARVAAMLLLTLRGTPTMYYGDEIGMRNVPIPPDRVQDPWERNVPGLGVGRDPARTPMQWDDGPNAGFTSRTPWLPLAADCRAVNVAAQRRDPGSILSLYRALIALRRAEPALSVGGYMLVEVGDGFLSFLRQHGRRRLLTALNMSGIRQTVTLPTTVGGRGRLLLSTHLDRRGEIVAGAVELRAAEGVIIALGDGGPA